MNEIEKKALALENDIRVNQGYPQKDLFIWSFNPTTQALCRAIEQHEADKAEHEAYKQDVSDALEKWFWRCPPEFGRFIILKPSVDPLSAALAECEGVTKPAPGYDHDAKVLREALAKRGLKIVEDV